MPTPLPATSFPSLDLLIAAFSRHGLIPRNNPTDPGSPAHAIQIEFDPATDPIPNPVPTRANSVPVQEHSSNDRMRTASESVSRLHGMSKVACYTLSLAELMADPVLASMLTSKITKADSIMLLRDSVAKSTDNPRIVVSVFDGLDGTSTPLPELEEPSSSSVKFHIHTSEVFDAEAIQAAPATSLRPITDMAALLDANHVGSLGSNWPSDLDSLVVMHGVTAGVDASPDSSLPFARVRPGTGVVIQVIGSANTPPATTAPSSPTQQKQKKQQRKQQQQHEDPQPDEKECRGAIMTSSNSEVNGDRDDLGFSMSSTPGACTPMRFTTSDHGTGPTATADHYNNASPPTTSSSSAGRLSLQQPTPTESSSAYSASTGASSYRSSASHLTGGYPAATLYNSTVLSGHTLAGNQSSSSFPSAAAAAAVPAVYMQQVHPHYAAVAQRLRGFVQPVVALPDGSVANLLQAPAPSPAGSMWQMSTAGYPHYVANAFATQGAALRAAASSAVGQPPTHYHLVPHHFYQHHQQEQQIGSSNFAMNGPPGTPYGSTTLSMGPVPWSFDSGVLAPGGVVPANTPAGSMAAFPGYGTPSYASTTELASELAYRVPPTSLANISCGNPYVVPMRGQPGGPSSVPSTPMHSMTHLNGPGVNRRGPYTTAASRTADPAMHGGRGTTAAAAPPPSSSAAASVVSSRSQLRQTCFPSMDTVSEASGDSQERLSPAEVLAKTAGSTIFLGPHAPANSTVNLPSASTPISTYPTHQTGYGSSMYMPNHPGAPNNSVVDLSGRAIGSFAYLPAAPQSSMATLAYQGPVLVPAPGKSSPSRGKATASSGFLPRPPPNSTMQLSLAAASASAAASTARGSGPGSAWTSMIYIPTAPPQNSMISLVMPPHHHHLVSGADGTHGAAAAASMMHLPAAPQSSMVSLVPGHSPLHFDGGSNFGVMGGDAGSMQQVMMSMMVPAAPNNSTVPLDGSHGGNGPMATASVRRPVGMPAPSQTLVASAKKGGAFTGARRRSADPPASASSSSSASPQTAAVDQQEGAASSTAEANEKPAALPTTPVHVTITKFGGSTPSLDGSDGGQDDHRQPETQPGNAEGDNGQADASEDQEEQQYYEPQGGVTWVSAAASVGEQQQYQQQQQQQYYIYQPTVAGVHQTHPDTGAEAHYYQQQQQQQQQYQPLPPPLVPNSGSASPHETFRVASDAQVLEYERRIHELSLHVLRVSAERDAATHAQAIAVAQLDAIQWAVIAGGTTAPAPSPPIPTLVSTSPHPIPTMAYVPTTAAMHHYWQGPVDHGLSDPTATAPLSQSFVGGGGAVRVTKPGGGGTMAMAPSAPVSVASPRRQANATMATTIAAGRGSHAV
ncbi:hypothetical protein BC828DRAFT_437486 [Blastocladiella britannica]|nr:hypothetical protein BC828DRAFT_437486 [Blastocladiella britannica]